MRKNLISIIFTISFIALMSSSVFASMTMPRYGINEQTKECSEFFMGDECVGCAFPDGWQMIKESQCPTGYKEIQKNSVCTPIKDFFCCTVSHSGANGDCEDVVVNYVEQKCAFVEDINKCGKLPQNWKKAEETEVLLKDLITQLSPVQQQYFYRQIRNFLADILKEIRNGNKNRHNYKSNR